jgi:ABC-type branched-subunit amino acid transport system substrate-binding protein
VGFGLFLESELELRDILADRAIGFMPGGEQQDVVRDLARSAPDTIVLIAHPPSGAELVRQWAVLGEEQVSWYLGPQLKDASFLANVPPGLLNGAVGVSPGIHGNPAQFKDLFAKRFGGTLPTDDAYFAFDAAALTALAVARAHAAGAITPEAVREGLVALSRPPGVGVQWSDLSSGVSRLMDGTEIDYRGASGSADLDEDGELLTPTVSFWAIESDAIVERE